jgi:hypothetical protein
MVSSRHMLTYVSSRSLSTQMFLADRICC